MSTAEQPIMCTLTTKDQASQALEWTDLHGKALHTEPLDGGAAMTFPAELAAGVEDLAAREATCCAFLDIVTTVDGDIVRVEITSENPDALPIIELLAGTGGK
jgi:hypothetical protein